MWLVGCSILVVWLGSVNKSEFDPNLKLSQAIMDLSFEEQLIDVIDAINANSSATNARIIHITQKACYCDWLSLSHQSSLNDWASKHNYETTQINLNDSPQLTKFIPSTPAVIAIDKNNQLIYVGPYSRGGGCFSQSGKINDQLTLWAQKKETVYKQTVIDTDAKGCYCSFST